MKELKKREIVDFKMLENSMFLKLKPKLVK